MWFQNKRLSLYWIENQLSVWLKMVITPNTPDKFPEEFISYEMVKSAICKKQCGMKEVCKWHTLEPIILVRVYLILY